MAKTIVCITNNQADFRFWLNSFLGKEVDLAKKKSGAPYIVGDNHKLSISHKDNRLVAAISLESVGVDIEKIDQRKSVFKIADKYFGEKIEKGDFEGFYRAWTKKEALCKMYEKGLTKGFLALNLSEETYIDKNNQEVHFNSFYFDEYIVTTAEMSGDVEFILV